jgi:hypothetical protein
MKSSTTLDDFTHSAPLRQSFDFTAAIRAVALDMVARLPDLAHIDLARVAIAFRQARKPVRHGLFASLTPMRFAGGSLTEIRRGRRIAVQRLFDERGREMLYILNVYLPRFMEIEFREKLITILHELWHISPEFNGDLRRHAGRCHVHTHSQAAYDAEMGRLADRWLALNPPADLHSFLQLTFGKLLARHGGIHGVRIAQPKLIPLT